MKQEEEEEEEEPYCGNNETPNILMSVCNQLVFAEAGRMHTRSVPIMIYRCFVIVLWRQSSTEEIRYLLDAWGAWLNLSPF